ncbi:phosphoglucosamine mutase, partial [Pseudomonas aeruginosa]
QERGRLQGGVVGTLMSNLALELTLQELHLPFVRAKAGDRSVVAELLDRNWMLGGENSGHIVCCQHTETGDDLIPTQHQLMEPR